MKKKIKILTSVSSSVWGGDEIEIDASEAESLISAGYAKEVKEGRKNAMAKTRGRRKAIKE
jgi:hypothetical protein